MDYLYSAVKAVTWGPLENGIKLGYEGKHVYDLINGKVPWKDWPNEAKGTVVVVGGVAVLALVYMAQPLLWVPSDIIKFFLEGEFSVVEWALKTLDYIYFDLCDFIGVSRGLANGVLGVDVGAAGMVLLQRIADHFLFGRHDDPAFVAVYNLLTTPITWILEFLNPSYWSKKQSKLPVLGWIYDWTCFFVTLPLDIVAMLLTPFVRFFYVPESYITDAEKKQSELYRDIRNAFDKTLSLTEDQRVVENLSDRHGAREYDFIDEEPENYLEY